MQEIEVKFLLEEEDKEKLEDFLEQSEAELVKKEEQDNWYYTAPGENDLRIRRTDKEAFLILKKGWMHDESRQEIEVQVARKDFEVLDEILRALGYKYDTKWYRRRSEYGLEDFTITLDFNAGYSWVAEIEKVVTDGDGEEAMEEILELAQKIGLKPTPAETFDKMYAHYKDNWQHYVKSGETFRLEDL